MSAMASMHNLIPTHGFTLTSYGRSNLKKVSVLLRRRVKLIFFRVCGFTIAPSKPFRRDQLT
jgi:hypothetical protein